MPTTRSSWLTLVLPTSLMERTGCTTARAALPFLPPKSAQVHAFFVCILLWSSADFGRIYILVNVGKFHGKGVDIWAMGITLYCFVFGRVPFEGGNITGLYKAIIADE